MNAESKRPFAPADVPRRYARARTYDTRHIRLELHLDPRRPMLRGKATITLVPLDPLRHVELDLATTLHVDGVREAGGGSLRFEHAEDRLRILLPRTKPAGRALELVIAYHGRPRRGLYFVGATTGKLGQSAQIWSQGQDEDSKHWFPCFDHPHDKATSEVIATVPKPFRVVSNGQLLALRVRGGNRTFHWREDAPHPAYLLSIVVGEYDEIRDPDGAVPLLYYVPHDQRGDVERTFGRTAAMLRFFSQRLDFPYPYEKYAQVVVRNFIFGGMENISATTLTDAVCLDATAATETHSDNLIAHELAHQWWGNLLTCKEWSHAWLNEGFATYAEALWLEQQRGRDEFLWKLRGDAESYFSEDAIYERPIVERRYTRPVEIFDRHLYEKGGLVLHMLRHELGETHFWKAMRHYVRKHAFQNVETTDWKVAIEESTGRHLDAFFDQWVYGAGFPQIQASWSWDAAARQVRLQLRQTQATDDRRTCFALPLDVELGFARGAVRQRVRMEKTPQTLLLPAAERPLYVRIDPEHELLMKLSATPSRSELLAQLQHALDLNGQVDAAHELERFVGDVEVAGALTRALRRARFHGTTGEIARALARVGGEGARRTLLAALSGRDPRRRRVIVRALAALREDVPVHAPLMKLWEREPGYLVRAEILRTLARRRAPDTLALCRRALRTDSHRDSIRTAALEALALLHDEAGIDMALPYARPGHSRWVRAAAMKTLATLGQSFPLHGHAIQDLLTAALREDDFFANLAAAEALGQLRRPDAIAALRALAVADVDRRIQRMADEAASSLSASSSSPQAWKALGEELRLLRLEQQETQRRLGQLEARSRSAKSPKRRQKRK